MRAEVVIVGAGLAGIAAAVELLDQGVPVCLVDAGTEDRAGGLARWSFGGLFYVDSPLQRRRGIRDSEQQALEDWLSYASFGEDDHWPRRWAEQYVARCTPEVYEWLKPRGIRYIPFIQWLERGMTVHGNRVPRFHMVWGTGHRLVQALLDTLADHPNRRGLRLHFRHRVTELLRHGGRMAGVRGIDEATGQPFEIASGQVVLAAGGIVGDPDVMRAHWYQPWGAPPPHLLTGSYPHANGSVHQLAAGLGATLTHLDKHWSYPAGVHHPTPHHAHHGLSLVPPKSAIWVDARGRRIGPHPMISGFDTRLLVEQIVRQPGQYSWQIMNARIARKELFVSGAQFNEANRDQRLLPFVGSLLFGNRTLIEALRNHGQDWVEANTIEDLAARMNRLTGTADVDAAALRAALEAYDQAVRRGPGQYGDPQLALLETLRSYRGDRMRTCNFQPILDTQAGPLIAIREHILARKSLGGVQTDLGCQVLDAAGQPIAGLYAVGEIAGFGGGGIHGLRALEGTFLGNCIFNGRIAAQTILGRHSQPHS
ncbi:MAG: FAD-binding dehydrogenase [Bacteroidia bacterium]